MGLWAVWVLLLHQASPGPGRPACAGGHETLEILVKAADGRPAAGAEVHLALDEDFGDVRLQDFVGSEVGDATWALSADGSGRLRVACLARAPLVIAAHHPDFAPSEIRWTPGTAAELTLPLGTRVTGSFRTDVGEAVAGANVTFQPLGAAPRLAHFHRDAVRTDALGAFTSPPLPPGRFRVVAARSSYATSAREVTVSDQPLGPVHLVLTMAAISGLVVEPGGRPVPGAHVRAVAKGVGEAIRFHRCGTVEGAGGVSATTDRHGRFRLELTAEEALNLSAFVDGDPPRYGHLHGVSLGSQGVRLQLDPEAPSRELRGRVVSESSAPAVVMVSTGGATLKVQPGADFSLSAEVRPSSRLFVFSRGMATAIVAIPTASSPVVDLGAVTLVKERPLSIGAIDAQSKKPLRDFGVHLDELAWANAQSPIAGIVPLERTGDSVVMRGIGRGKVSGRITREGYTTARFEGAESDASVTVALQRQTPKVPTEKPAGDAVLRVAHRHAGADAMRPMLVAGEVATLKTMTELWGLAGRVFQPGSCGGTGCRFAGFKPGRYVAIVEGFSPDPERRMFWVRPLDLVSGVQTIDLRGAREADAVFVVDDRASRWSVGASGSFAEP
jgi:Carboxypeptidase regulatory-like domain